MEVQVGQDEALQVLFAGHRHRRLPHGYLQHGLGGRVDLCVVNGVHIVDRLLAARDKLLKGLFVS